MVKLIMGLSGSGKTKTLVSLVREAADTAAGDVICIEKSRNLTYDIPSQVRLISASEYGISGNALLEGFLMGLHAGNFDITHVFIDDFYKLLDDRSNEAVEKLLNRLAAFSEQQSVTVTIIASADPATVSDGIRRFF